ncbi:MAG: hypothetical protein U9N73_00610 [Candidatus Auribacterota bacterium]|nr:hypothetical protein [Candidatus Auribacterota bacterium]
MEKNMKIILSQLSGVIVAVLAVSLLTGCAAGAKRAVTTGVSKKSGEKAKVNVGVSRTVERKADDKGSTVSDNSKSGDEE